MDDHLWETRRESVILDVSYVIYVHSDTFEYICTFWLSIHLDIFVHLDYTFGYICTFGYISIYGVDLCGLSITYECNMSKEQSKSKKC